MPEGLKLEELEAYRAELNNALREGRPCKYKNPREVYAEDPNLDSYLVEKDDDTLKAEQEGLDSQTAIPRLSDPGQEEAEKAATYSNTVDSIHQNMQHTPSPAPTTTDETPEGEETQTDQTDETFVETPVETQTTAQVPTTNPHRPNLDNL